MNKDFRSYIFVSIQFASIFYLMSVKSDYTLSLALIIEGIGVILGLWSVWVMRKSAFTVFPEPRLSIQLLVEGPYKLIRHPMYASLFLVLVPLVVTNFTIYRLIVLLIFTINQIFKINFEEKLLLQKLDNYGKYMKNTWRLFPYIY